MRTCARTTLGGVHFGEFDVQHFGLCICVAQGQEENL